MTEPRHIVSAIEARRNPPQVIEVPSGRAARRNRRRRNPPGEPIVIREREQDSDDSYYYTRREATSRSPRVRSRSRSRSRHATSPQVHAQKSDGSALLVNSTISRDRTEGKKANEDESLRALNKAKSKKSQVYTRRVRRVDSSGETLGSTDVSVSPRSTSLTRPIYIERRSSFEGSYTTSESDEVIVEEEGQSESSSESDKNLPWRTDYLRERYLARRAQKLKELARTQRAGQSKRQARLLLADTDGNIYIGPPLEELSGVDTQVSRNLRENVRDSRDSHYRHPQLATTAARRAKLKLGLNLYDGSPLSKFFGWMLDIVDKQSLQINFLRSQQTGVLPTNHHQPTGPPSRSPSPDASKDLARHQVLHRVQCDRRSHRHGSRIFLDSPVRRGVELNGTNVVWDLTKYLCDNVDIVFVVFQDYQCDGALNSRLQLERSKKTRTDNVGTYEILPDDEYIYVVSDTLRAALIEVAECSPFDSEVDGEMIAPYLFVYHHRAELQKLSEKRQGEFALHISSLLSYIESRYGRDYEDADTKFAKGVVTPEHLTKLWVPNQILVARKDNHAFAYALKEWPSDRRKFERGEQKDLRLRCWSWEYDGSVLKRQYHSQSVNLASHDEIAIEKLSIFPQRYASKELQDLLRVRGEKFWSFRNQHLVNYSGQDFKKETNYRNNRFMIDTQTYQKMHKKDNYSDYFDRRRRDEASDRFDSWPETIPREEELDNDNLTILPPNIYAFDFQEKEWVSLCVDLLSDVKWNKGAFNRLVLPSKTKELIQALVTTQISGQVRDVIENKGSGLVVLLHGGPGTGKTLTAESVAEIAEKPLYRVTCGDIGTNAVEVEKYLTSIFHLGKIWGCVLLLDEADVFLEERTLADLQRNSFVSVFLRMLEYYDGILILTSNRVGTFDAAFKSRIQVSIHYSNLSRAARKKIWRNFLDMLEEMEDEVDIAELEGHLDSLAEDEMNGRQIRNCVTTARQLAAFRKQKLGWQHLEQVIKTASEFNRYLKEVHEGLTEDEIAREDNLR